MEENYYQTVLKPFLEANSDDILGTLGSRFTENDFADKFQRMFPNEYAEALREFGTLLSMNSWIAQYFLSKLDSVRNTGEKRDVITANGNKSSNCVWEKI